MTVRALLRRSSGAGSVALVALAALAVLACGLLAAAPAGAQTSAKVQPKPAAGASVPSAAQPVVGGLVDINHATRAELIAVPTIGEVYAARIIAGRPYANKTQLVQKQILTRAMYDRVKDKLIARQ